MCALNAYILFRVVMSFVRSCKLRTRIYPTPAMPCPECKKEKNTTQKKKSLPRRAILYDGDSLLEWPLSSAFSTRL